MQVSALNTPPVPVTLYQTLGPVIGGPQAGSPTSGSAPIVVPIAKKGVMIGVAKSHESLGTENDRQLIVRVPTPAAASTPPIRIRYVSPAMTANVTVDCAPQESSLHAIGAPLGGQPQPLYTASLVLNPLPQTLAVVDPVADAV